jgi:hypothetical protein
MERRFRWNLRQVMAAVDETKRAAATSPPGSKPKEREAEFIDARLDALRAFAAAVDTGISAFSVGNAWLPESLRQVPLPPRALPGA